MAPPDVSGFLASCARQIPNIYWGNPLELAAFINSIELLKKLAVSDENKNILVCYIKTRVAGKAIECIEEENELDRVVLALKTNIKPENSKVIAGRLMALQADRANLTDFGKRAEILCESYQRSLILEGTSRKKAVEFTIDRAIELCKVNTTSDIMKAVLVSGRFEDASEVIAKYMIESRNIEEERRIRRFRANDRNRGYFDEQSQNNYYNNSSYARKNCKSDFQNENFNENFQINAYNQTIDNYSNFCDESFYNLNENSQIRYFDESNSAEGTEYDGDMNESDFYESCSEYSVRDRYDEENYVENGQQYDDFARDVHVEEIEQVRMYNISRVNEPRMDEFIVVNIEGKETEVLVDSQGDISLLKYHVSMGELDISREKKVEITGITKEAVITYGTVVRLINVNGSEILHEFHLVPGYFPIAAGALLGRDFLKKYKCNLNYENNMLTITKGNRKIVVEVFEKSRKSKEEMKKSGSNSKMNQNKVMNEVKMLKNLKKSDETCAYNVSNVEENWRKKTLANKIVSKKVNGANFGENPYFKKKKKMRNSLIEKPDQLFNYRKAWF